MWKIHTVFRDVERSNVILHETDDYVGTVKNDIIQPSCQHSLILLSEGNVGPLGCLLHIGERDLLYFLHVGQFLFYFYLDCISKLKL